MDDGGVLFCIYNSFNDFVVESELNLLKVTLVLVLYFRFSIAPSKSFSSVISLTGLVEYFQLK